MGGRHLLQGKLRLESGFNMRGAKGKRQTGRALGAAYRYGGEELSVAFSGGRRTEGWMGVARDESGSAVVAYSAARATGPDPDAGALSQREFGRQRQAHAGVVEE